MEKLIIIGLGPGNPDMLTAKAKDSLAMQQRVYNTREIPLTELTLELSEAGRGDAAVLVSGDCGFFSAAKMLINDLSDKYDIELIPGISSIQYMSAKLRVAYDDAALISLHGRKVNIVPIVCYNKKIFALAGGINSPGEICGTLSRHGLGDVTVSVGEWLSYPDEKIVTGSAFELKGMGFGELSVVYIENPKAVNPLVPLRDSDFIRDGGVPMTKEEVRWLSIQKLGAAPSDVIYDVGAGTGSVSVELARRAFSGFVYAIEDNADACNLVRENAKKHGAHNVEAIHGKAPEAFENLPAPDKAFIGGSSGNMDGILKKLIRLNSSIKIVANAITIQTLNQIVEGFSANGITNTDIVCVNIAKSRKISGYDLMTAQNPVYIITGEESDE